MNSIISIINVLYAETYFAKYKTAEHEFASNNYDQKREMFLKRLDKDLHRDFVSLEDLRGQVEIAREDELLQFVFDFCCNLFFDMFLKQKPFLSDI